MFTRSKHFALLTATAVLAATLAFTALPDRPPTRYVFETVDVPFGTPGEDFDMQILWMNNPGVITVQFQTPRSPEFLENMHTAVLRGGEWTIIDIPNAVTSGGTNANNHGQVVISHEFGDGVWHAAVHGRHGMTTLPDIPGYPGGIIVQGVNDRGQIAALVIDADGGLHGFFGDGEDYSIFDYPDPDVEFTQSNMINNRGVGVGTYIAAGAWHAFKWEDGAITNIDPPADQGTDASATGINNAGVIVGVWVNPDGDVTGYVQDDDEFTEFAVPDSTYTVPYFINDHGQISGVYGDADGVAHGFVATPRHGRRQR